MGSVPMWFAARESYIYDKREGVQIMRILGRNMAYHLKCQEAGKKAGINMPEKEKTKLTNFIR